MWVELSLLITIKVSTTAAGSPRSSSMTLFSLQLCFSHLERQKTDCRKRLAPSCRGSILIDSMCSKKGTQYGAGVWPKNTGHLLWFLERALVYVPPRRRPLPTSQTVQARTHWPGFTRGWWDRGWRGIGGRGCNQSTCLVWGQTLKRCWPMPRWSALNLGRLCVLFGKAAFYLFSQSWIFHFGTNCSSGFCGQIEPYVIQRTSLCVLACSLLNDSGLLSIPIASSWEICNYRVFSFASFFFALLTFFVQSRVILKEGPGTFSSGPGSIVRGRETGNSGNGSGCQLLHSTTVPVTPRTQRIQWSGQYTDKITHYSPPSHFPSSHISQNSYLVWITECKGQYDDPLYWDYTYLTLLPLFLQTKILFVFRKGWTASGRHKRTPIIIFVVVVHCEWQFRAEFV